MKLNFLLTRFLFNHKLKSNNTIFQFLVKKNILNLKRYKKKQESSIV